MIKLLIIEDDDLQRNGLLEMLGFEAYDVLGGNNGRDGVLLAQSYKPNLIICDINMPILDGFGMITELRQYPHTADIPVIFLSAQNTQAVINRGLQLGAAAYITKPYAFKELLTIIRTHIDG